MKLIPPFEFFDPISGEAPERYAFMFAEVLIRARSILQGRTSEEIKQGAPIINKIERDPAYVNPDYESLKKPPIKTLLLGKEEELFPSYIDEEALYQNIGNISLAKYPVLPNAQWQEVFAILAISYVEKLYREIKAQQDWKEIDWLPKITDHQIDTVAHDYLLLARQAITFAETLINQSATVKSLSSELAKKAAHKRHQSRSAPLKAAVLSLYQEKHQSRSNREAARRIFEYLEKQGRLDYDGQTNKVYFEKQLALQTDDPEHRFEKWIGSANRLKPK